MKFDLRKQKKKSQPKRKGAWDLRNYKPRPSTFKGIKSFEGKKITKDVLKIFGEEIIKAIKEEAKKASGRGAGIPQTKSFYDSFSYEIVKGGKIKVLSSWEWVKKYLERREPYEMKWLRREKGKSKVIPLKTKTGKVIFRQAPLVGNRGWVHPAISKYNFIDRGIEVGEKRAIRRAVSYFKTH